ncbi:MAG: hypothetical protein AAFX62_07035, partial [Pseudomonadota bacterium]
MDRTAFLGVAHSVTGRRWVGASVETERLGLAIAQTADLPEIVGRVLATRGVLPEEADAYLAPTLGRRVHIGQRARIRHQVPQRRGEIGVRLLGQH